MENINDNAALNNDVEKYRNLAALSYVLMPLAAVMLILDKDSNSVRHHVNQVICLLLWFMASSVVMIIPFLGWIAGVVGMVAGYGLFQEEIGAAQLGGALAIFCGLFLTTNSDRIAYWVSGSTNSYARHKR